MEAPAKYNTYDWLQNYEYIGLTKEHIKRLNNAINILKSLNEPTDAKYLKEIKDKLLEVKEVKEVDLEKEIKNRIDSLCNLYCYMEDLFNGNEEEGVYPIPENVTNELFEFAKYFFELGLKA